MKIHEWESEAFPFRIHMLIYSNLIGIFLGFSLFHFVEVGEILFLTFFVWIAKKLNQKVSPRENEKKISKIMPHFHLFVPDFKSYLSSGSLKIFV